MAKSTFDASFSTEIFRKNWPQIIALKRELAVIQPVLLAYSASGYKAGQVLAYNSVSGVYEKYSAASASYEAKAILPVEVKAEEQMSASANAAPALFSGYVYQDKLTDLDANAIADLGGKSYADASAINIFKF